MKGHWIPPSPKGFIDRIAAKLGYSKTIPAGLGSDVVEAVDTLNGKIDDLHKATFLLPDIVSLADLKSKLLTVASGMDNHTNKSLGFWISADSSPFLTYGNYIGNLHIAAKPENQLFFSGDFTSNSGDLVIIGYSNGTWTINRVTDQIANITGDTVDVTSPASVASDVTINAMKCLYYPHLKIAFLTFNITFTSSLAHNSTVFTLPDTIPSAKMQCNTDLSAVNATSIAGRMSISGRNIIAFGYLAPAQFVMGTIVYPTY